MLTIPHESHCGLCGGETRTLLWVKNDKLIINCIPCKKCISPDKVANKSNEPTLREFRE